MQIVCNERKTMYFAYNYVSYCSVFTAFGVWNFSEHFPDDFYASCGKQENEISRAF